MRVYRDKEERKITIKYGTDKMEQDISNKIFRYAKLMSKRMSQLYSVLSKFHDSVDDVDYDLRKQIEKEIEDDVDVLEEIHNGD